MTASRDIIRRLLAEGWVEVAVKGSHHHFKHPDKRVRVTVPRPVRDIKPGTLRSIFRQADWPWK